VVDTLPEGESVRGMTLFDKLLYLLRGGKSSEQIEVYDIDSYSFQRCLTVPGLGIGCDVAACTHDCSAYISDHSNRCIHRVGLPQGVDVTNWPVNDIPFCLSVTDTHSVLVTCHKVRTIKEFSTDGKLLRQIQLSQDVVTPLHTIQLSSGEFVVCHGDRNDPVHRVCLIGSDGHVVNSYEGYEDSGNQQISVPFHLAIDRNEFVFVADMNNDRVLLLSPALTFVREVVSQEKLKWTPARLWLDLDRRRLYVAVKKMKDGKSAGQVVVVAV